MQSETDSALKSWIEELPASRMVFPSASLTNQLKYAFWRVYTPCHPFFRDTLQALKVVKPKHTYRQPYLLGKINPKHSVEEVIMFLVGKGYGNHFVAWKDKGELVSLRHVTDFVYQHHIRIFEDGEVRGHYEYTPECHPFLHLHEALYENRSNEFTELLKGYIVPAQ